MQLVTACMIAAALFAASEPGSGQNPEIVVIGVLREDYHSPQNTDNNKVYVLTPAAVLQNGAWVSHKIFSLHFSDDPMEPDSKTFSPEQDALLDLLLKQTFYHDKDASGIFKPKKKTIAHICDDGLLGLHGALTGEIDKIKLEEGLAMTNNRKIMGTMRAGTLTDGDKHLLGDRMPKCMEALIKKVQAKNPDAAAEPAFSKENYLPPEYITVTRCSLPGGWEGLWIHAKLTYPAELSPPPAYASIDERLWSGYYFAFLDAKTTSGDRILWDYACMPGYSWDDLRYHLMGVFDVNADGQPEFLVDKGAHEYGAYTLVRFEEGIMEEISSVSGSLCKRLLGWGSPGHRCSMRVSGAFAE